MDFRKHTHRERVRKTDFATRTPRAFIAFWPNGDKTIVVATSFWQLFDELDSMADPMQADIRLLESGIVTDLQRNRKCTYGWLKSTSEWRKGMVRIDLKGWLSEKPDRYRQIVEGRVG